jgi:uncharacterized membrane protein
VPTLADSITVQASLADAWDYYFQPRGWPAWVDGFHAVDGSHGYPEEGGTLIWSSTPAGRGQVTEQVLAHEPRKLHRISFTDPESSGELETTFEISGDEKTTVGLQLTYALASGGAFAWLAERFFVRGQVAKSLRRTLLRYRLEVEELAAMSRASEPSPGADR